VLAVFFIGGCVGFVFCCWWLCQLCFFMVAAAALIVGKLIGYVDQWWLLCSICCSHVMLQMNAVDSSADCCCGRYFFWKKYTSHQ